ncbi:MAG: leucine-rich repeat protein [Oscillospiraceae bacterium]|nr:leucine-rich repeat protein [Oscillospiraceae bacterium]
MKIRDAKFYFYIPLILFLLFLPACAAKPSEPAAPLVKIMVSVPDGVAVESENPVYVSSGGTAEFMLKIDDGFKLESIETVDSELSALSGGDGFCGAFYENGLLRFEGAVYPSTLRLDIRPIKTYRCFIENNIKMGIATSNVEQGRIPEDTFVSVSAEALEDCIFIGWSKGALMSKGGQFLSHSQNYSFTLVSDMFIYPNYLSKNGQYIKYSANGGVLAGAGPEQDEADILYYEVNTKHYPCPNAFGDTGIFSREGYALIGYNTEPDGGGVSIGLGCNVAVMPQGENVLELYAQWVKYSDADLFSYTESNEKITITGYEGNEEMLVIPEEIDGLPVAAVSNGAIKSNELKTLFLTRNITSLSVRAISNCPNLETLYISDSITKMPNESISNCPNLSNFYVSAVIAPRYSDALGWGSSIKYKRLITAPGKRLTVISGSSSAFGLNSPLLSELLDGEYSIVNYGTHAGVCALFFLEFTANQTREGDIVVMAPEPVWESQQGANWLDALTFQIVEGAYDAFRHVDIRNYANVFAAFADFNSTRKNMGAGSYDEYIDDVNIYGDILTNQADHPVDYVAGGQWISFGNIMNRDGAARINRVNDIIKSKNGRFYLACSPVNRNALVDKGDTEKRQLAYRDNLERLLELPVISFPGDYVFPGNFFSDTDHHLNDIHSADRTIQLAKDLKAQFEKEELSD